MGHFFHEIFFFAISSPTKNIDLAQKRGVLRADSHMVNIDSRVARFCPDLPGFARFGDPGRSGSKPFPHAPEFRKALVGKAQLPQTTTTTTTTTTTATTATTTTTTTQS